MTHFIDSTLASGLGFVAMDEVNKVIGEIHAYTPDVYCFSHVLSNLTIAVAPGYQGKGVGRLLLNTFCKTAEEQRSDITRIELFARESNKGAISLYQSLGFKIEGSLTKRIKNQDGSLESDILMAWIRQ